MLAKILFLVGSLVAIALIALLIIQAKNNAEIAQIWQTLEPRTPSIEAFSPDLVADQPEPVQRYFLHAIAPGTLLANAVYLTMKGSIRLAPNQDWMPLQAEELLSTVGFVWQAKAGQGMLQMQGADYYTAGTGRMRFSLWGLLPVVNAQSPDLIRSAIGRSVGELFWLPSVLLPQRGVSWQAIDDNTIQASLALDNEPITVTFVIDNQGRLLKSSFLRWGDQTEDQHYANIPFGGKYQAEQTFGGYTIPTQMGAGWWIDSDRYFEFFRVTIEQAAFL
ncbi:DUF6920 family protein [Leptolyngbya sp. GGD]|uniref:DUF6920 family protein n=1 Tax=Leptolyngbya sp. GGD TaxID=2997907 RepID=UPI00227D1592|nr:DUF6544 family protein [Leptolyngbya sp. GGD]MCY6492983.1 hypothetical protein [Leptolyngbya sp. GGD]